MRLPKLFPDKAACRCLFRTCQSPRAPHAWRSVPNSKDRGNLGLYQRRRNKRERFVSQLCPSYVPAKHSRSRTFSMVTGLRLPTSEGPFCSAGQSPFSSAADKAGACIWGLYYEDTFSKEIAQKALARHMPGCVSRPAARIR